MERGHRISAGAIVINDEKILLVRYEDHQGGSFLAAPGGGVNIEESTSRAAVRETLEETGLEISAGKILFIEDMLSRHHRIAKIWFLCKLSGGKLEKTRGAKEEGIIDVGWYNRNQLEHEVVYPTPLLTYNWDDFSKDNWSTIYLELREVDF